jgi:hypothetical protein
MWAQESEHRRIRAGERILFTPARAGRTGVCLAYPNRYRVAMGNLGFHAVYRILATAPGHWCERAFLPEGELASASSVTIRRRRHPPPGERA